MRQSVALDGAGAKAFEDGKTSIRLIHGMFDRSFEENKLEALNECDGSDAEKVETYNRYLTPRRDAPHAQHIEFGRVIDPKGILKEMATEGAGFVHTEDNMVSYWQQKTSAEGKKK